MVKVRALNGCRVVVQGGQTQWEANLEKVLEELEEVEMEVGWEEVEWEDGKVCRGGAEILVS